MEQQRIRVLMPTLDCFLLACKTKAELIFFLLSKLANTSLNCDISNRKLVLIELKGGNDGLNTLIPYDNYEVLLVFQNQ